MRVLVIGSGGREHALVWKIRQSKLVKKIFCAPGNGGISELAECLGIKAGETEKLLDFVKKEKIDLTVVGPELPLAGGIVDEFKKHDLKIFGPDQKAAQLEASKIFAKQLMAKYKVPTADFKIFDNANLARKYLDERPMPCVVKADGLAAGKGVVVAKTIEEAKQAVTQMLEGGVFGDSGRRIVIEDCLEGEEASIIVVTDAQEVITLASSQDHKRVFDHDQGPNTGGMGAYSPAPVVSAGVFKEVLENVIYRLIHALAKEGIIYKGALYAGIMLTRQGPRVLEFNVRFGDPETQAILPRLQSDLVELMLATVNSKLTKFNKSGGLSWEKRACVCVVCAAGGYPGEYEKGKEIFGLKEAAQLKDIVVFHAGTEKSCASADQPSVKYLTSGGRVLGVTGLGDTIQNAIRHTYQAVEKINFSGMHYRKDIAEKALS